MAHGYYLYFEDTDGDKSKSSLWVGDGVVAPSAMADLITALEPITTASVYKHAISNVVQGAGAAAQANPYDVRDKAEFRFTDDQGNIQTVTIPAPLSTIFLDDDTIDTANLDVIDFKDQCIAHFQGRGGEALVTFLGGSRIRAPRRS